MRNIKNLMNKLPHFLKNKYVLSLIFFVIWIIFLDDYNMIKQKKIKKRVDELKRQKNFYINETRKDSHNLYKLMNDSIAQEKFAREKFLMKKENEDIFIIRNKEDE